MAVVVFGGNQQLTYTAGTGATTPVDQYAAWCAELGVSAVTTLDALDDDDVGFSSTLAASFFEGGSTGLMFSSEAAIGLYKTAPTNTASTAYSIANVSRMYALISRPLLLLTFHPASDLRSESCKIQRSGTTTLIFGNFRRYDSETFRFQAAIRITPQRVEFVGRAIDSSTGILLNELVETTSTTVVQQILAATAAVGENTTFQIDVETITPEGLLSDSGPLGAPQMLGVGQVQGIVEVASPLGEPAALSLVTVPCWLAVDGPLGAAQTVAYVTTAGLAEVASPLGEGAALGFHDFTEMLGSTVTRYLMDLITPGGPVRVPISSWQATQQTDGACYAQCVVPACADWTDDIDAATEFVIYRATALADGTEVELEMVRSEVGNVAYDRGSRNWTATISGYDDAIIGSEDPPAVYDRTLAGLRTISVSGGNMRARCSIDWLLRPGHRAYIDGTPIVVAYINYYVNGNDAYMDVGERV